MKSVCVYCGSGPGERPKYKANTIELGSEMVEYGLMLVCGGGNAGLMDVMANAMLYGGSPAVDVIPKSLVRKEVGHKELTELHVVGSIYQYEQMMIDQTDAFITIPGGVGTCEELLETSVWLQLGYHDKPIGLLSVAGFYDKLFVFVSHAVQEDFFRRHYADLLHVNDDPAALIDMLARAPRETVDKWPERRECM